MNNEYADEVDRYMEEWLGNYTKEELLALALEHRVPLGPVRGFDEVRRDESLAGFYGEIDRPDTGPVSYPGMPYALDSPADEPPGPAPYLGQYNSDVYCGLLDFTPEQLVKLYQTGII